MKLTRFFSTLTLGVALTALVATGCKKPGYTTDLPSRSATAGSTGRVTDPGRGTPLMPGSGAGGFDVQDLGPDSSIPLPARGSHDGWMQDPSILANETIHFAFDSSVVRQGDLPKLQNVANYLTSNPNRDVLIEGHTDEIGTEEYNRALGERRALAAREQLVRLGIAPERIETISFGEDRPVDTGRTQAAFARNRRAEFVVLIPPVP